MFNVQGTELVIILLLALVVLGPEKLPEAMRRAGQFVRELRKMSDGFQEEFHKAVDEPANELRNTGAMLRDSADFTKLVSGERDEKPKSAEMGDAESAEPTINVDSAHDVMSSAKDDLVPIEPADEVGEHADHADDAGDADDADVADDTTSADGVERSA